MQHLFSVWSDVAHRLKNSKRILLLSDYDGTLTPIVERPELAEIPLGMKDLLKKLTHRGKFTLGVISGRALADLKSRVGIDGIIYAGNHGLEIEAAGFTFVEPLAEEIKPLLRLLHQVLIRSLASVRGAFVENKGLSLTVHYRLIEGRRANDLKSAFENAVNTSRMVGKIKTTTGKKIFEVRPAIDWDKGKAIELLVERSRKGGKTPLPIFIGDDRTDEDGFKALEKYEGISIYVGEDIDKSCASYYLSSTLEVERFLKLLLEPN